jgi:flagellar basal body-associated protein FliL
MTTWLLNENVNEVDSFIIIIIIVIIIIILTITIAVKYFLSTFYGKIK